MVFSRKFIVFMAVLPLLMLLTFTLMNNGVSIRTSSGVRTSGHVVICIYRYGGASVLVHRLVEELSEHYDNLTIILFTNLLDLGGKVPLRRCDVLLGVDSMVVVVLKYAGILKPITPTLHYSYRLPPRAGSMFVYSYGIPYCYYELFLDGNVTKSIEDYVYSYINGGAGVISLGARGAENFKNSIISYEVIVLLNPRQGIGELVDILLSNNTQSLLEGQTSCKSIYRVPSRSVQRVNVLELMYVLRRIGYNLREHILSRSSSMGAG